MITSKSRDVHCYGCGRSFFSVYIDNRFKVFISRRGRGNDL